MDLAIETLTPVLVLGLVLAIGLGLLLALGVGGERLNGLARGLGLLAAALALGLTLAFARASVLAPIGLTIGPSLGDTLAPLPSKLPPASALAILALLVAGLWVTRGVWRLAGLVLAGIFALALALDNGLFGILASWTALVLLDRSWRPTDDPDEAADRAIAPHLRLIVVGAPLLWFAVELAGRSASAAGFILVGVATAGLPPLGARRRSSEPIPDGLLPVVGYILTARGLLADSSTLLVGLVAALATFAVAWNLVELRESQSVAPRPVLVGRVLMAGAFLLLAFAFWLGEDAAVVGLSVLVAGSIVVILGGAAAIRLEEDRGVGVVEAVEGLGGATSAPAAVDPALEPASADLSLRMSSARVAGNATVDPLLLLWSQVEALAERWSQLLATLEGRYALALGLLVVLIAIFGWPA